MRILSSIAVAAVMTFAGSASAAVMVAHVEGSVGGIHSTFTDRFGYPPLYVFSGPFVAEFTFDTEAGAAIALPAGYDGRNNAVSSGWIEFEAVRLELPSAEYSQVIASPTGFSLVAQHYIPNVVLDTISFTATFAGATGDLDAPMEALTATGGGYVSAASNYSTGGTFKIDLTGSCTYECAGMELDVTSFRLTEYVEPVVGGGVPEPATWAIMILGFGAAGRALRRRRAVLA